MSDKRQIQMILFKRGGKFFMAACRGLSKGCNVHAKQRQKMGPCEDCVPLEDENETIGSVYDRLNRGNA